MQPIVADEMCKHTKTKSCLLNPAPPTPQKKTLWGGALGVGSIAKH